jgi:hypothetical protein
MRNVPPHGGIISEYDHPFAPTNDEFHLPDDQEEPEADDMRDADLLTSPTWLGGNGPGTFGVFGDHAWTSPGTYSIRVTIQDSDGGVGIGYDSILLINGQH